jgi:glycosyltransferase involved in cell wall biosynthesis
VSARYAVVTPARNEQDNLPRLAAALAAQELAPAAWTVVDDGSTDATPDLLAEFAAGHPWAQLLPKPPETDGVVARGRREGRDLEAFKFGVGALDVPYDVVVKVDADVDFDPGYFAALIGRFEADPTLGIASGTCYEEEGGAWVRRTKSDTTVWGASRAYRRECVPDLMSLEPRMGWDGLDEVKVQLRGFTTATFVDLPFRHNRPEGGRELSSLHQGEALGRASWYMGYRPSYLALRALYRGLRQPAALAMIWGYGSAAVRRERRCPDPEVIAALRDRQRLRATFRRGAPAS